MKRREGSHRRSWRIWLADRIRGTDGAQPNAALEVDERAGRNEPAASAGDGATAGRGDDGAGRSIGRPQDPLSVSDQAALLSTRPAAMLVDTRNSRERFKDWAWEREAPTPPPPPVAPEEDPQPDKTGICFSGGGIRSAAYNLGALQVLKERGEFDKARYLAAVSGGSYIAAANSIVQRQSDEEALSSMPVYARGSVEEQWLRNHSSYLAPGLIQKILLVLRILGGFIINLTFVALTLFLVTQVVGWAYAHWLYPELRSVGASPNLQTGPWLPRLSTSWLRHAAWQVPGVIGFVVAMLPLLQVWPERRHRLLAGWAGRLLGISLAVFVLVIALPYAVVFVRHELSGLAENVGDLAGTQVTDTAKAEGSKVLGLFSTASALTLLGSLFRALWARKRSLMAAVLTTIAGPVLLVGTFVWYVNDAAASGITSRSLVIAAAATALFLFMYVISDLTAWSMHPFYRRRLASAFAVRRVRGEDGVERAVPLAENELLPLSRSQRDHGPELIVCAAANIADDGATPPGRNAASFTFSSREIGGPVVGYVRPTSEYERVLGRGRLDLTLPAAVAMSGAALSPSMGKMTRRSLMFLFALANVRLGVWLPNPRRMESWAARREAGKPLPRPRPVYLLFEMLGLDRLNDRFLYVTDGGHYENLGLVELLRRGCTRIYCFDASGDSEDSFFTIGEAIAIARSDLGVEIDIKPDEMRRPSDDGELTFNADTGKITLKKRSETKGSRRRGLCSTDHVLGTFTYRNGVKGYMVLAKAAVTAQAPWDVLAFEEKDKRFPNHSTADQLFNDEKFEAYRALGRFTARRAVDLMRRIDSKVDWQADLAEDEERRSFESLVRSAVESSR